jgi:xanthosine utilization system XapX-like protein
MQATPRVALTTLLALLLGYGLMEMGNTLQGTPLSVRGELARFTPAHSDRRT